MNYRHITRLTLALIGMFAFLLAGSHSVMAQQNGQYHHTRSNHHAQNYYENTYNSSTHVGGSWGSQSAYNNHQHHNLTPHRRYYDYHGNQYYLDLDTGIRIQL
jgi:hypothetical protein